MSRFLKILLCMCLVVVCHSCPRYRIITHLSDEELEWLTNRYVGETMFFQSQTGINDTVKITAIDIWNSLDSIDWYYYTIGDGVYFAGGRVYFSLRNRKVRDQFYLYKDSTELIYFGAELLARWAPASYLRDTSMQINGFAFDDIIFVREFPRKTIYRDPQPPVPVVSLAWSKQYGLVQYSFQDGTVFNRIDLK